MNCRDHLTKNQGQSRFHKGQRVQATKDGVTYLGTINCVIDMRTHYDYYVDELCCSSCRSGTLRCNKNDIKSPCCVACVAPCQSNIAAPKFHVGQRVRTTFGKDDHCGIVEEVEYCEALNDKWYYKVRMCKNDNGMGMPTKGIRHHGESLFEETSHQHFCCCCCWH